MSPAFCLGLTPVEFRIEICLPFAIDCGWSPIFICDLDLVHCI